MAGHMQLQLKAPEYFLCGGTDVRGSLARHAPEYLPYTDRGTFVYNKITAKEKDLERAQEQLVASRRRYLCKPSARWMFLHGHAFMQGVKT